MAYTTAWLHATRPFLQVPDEHILYNNIVAQQSKRLCGVATRKSLRSGNPADLLFFADNRFLAPCVRCRFAWRVGSGGTRLRSGSRPKIKLLFTHRQSYQNKLTRRTGARPFPDPTYIRAASLHRMAIVRRNICNKPPASRVKYSFT